MLDRGRIYRNQPENDLAELARANGWTPTKRGWPDFLCFNEKGEIIAVEVKPRSPSTGLMDPLKTEQADVMDQLTKHGIRCYVSDGKVLEPYDRGKHRPEARTKRSRLSRARRLAREQAQALA